MSYWNYFAPALALILCGYLLWAAYRRPNRKHNHLRALASLVAVISLYLLYLNISSEPKSLNKGAEEFIILTAGSSADTLDNLLSKKPGLTIYTTEPGIASINRKALLIDHINEIPGFEGNALLKNIDGINAAGSKIIRTVNSGDSTNTRDRIKSIDSTNLNRNIDIDERIKDESSDTGKRTDINLSITGNESGSPSMIIHVLGYGLDKAQLQALGKSTIVFHPTLIKRHFISINWNRQLNTGDKLLIQGSYNNNDSEKLNVILKGFNTTVDSVQVPGDQVTPFQLQTVPKQKGKAVYTLLVMQGNDTIEQEKIPFETMPARPINILMLASSPDFENKFLKTWLFANSYGVAIRTTVSRNKFNSEYLNITGIKADRINSTMLNNFDLVIADATALNSVSTGELNSIRAAVQQEGLGLIIKVDSVTKPSLFFNAPFRYIQSGSLNNHPLQLLTTDTSAVLPGLTTTRPLFISNPEQVRPVIRDKEGHLVSAAAISGNGKLLATTISNTYNWVLSGDTQAYRQYWSDLIGEASKTTFVNESYSIEPGLAVTDMPTTLMLESGDSLSFQGKVNRSLIPMNQQFILPFQWKGNYWPRKSGWQSITYADNQTFNWYSFGKNDWTSLLAVNTITANKLISTKSGHRTENKDDSPGNESHQYARLYLILIFIICCTYLWIEEKFRATR